MRRLLIAVLVLAGLAGGAALFVQQTQPAWWLRLWYPLDYRTAVAGYARQDKLDPALLAAVIYRESHFRPSARSDAGAVGLMQLLPDTAQGIAVHTGGTHFDPATDLLNPDLNIRYGAWYLRHLINHYDQYPNAVDLALAAYNAGQSNVDSWIAGTPTGRPVRIRFEETRDYVAAVRHLQGIYRKAYDAELGSGRTPT